MNMHSKRIIDHYKGFHIVAAFFRNEFQAKAKHKFIDELRVNKCEDLNCAVFKIKNIIDKYFIDNHEVLQERIIETHKLWMIQKGFEYKGVSNHPKYQRTNNCYSCKNSVDNSQDIECNACQWIICSYCGACGCGYTRM
jgi:hypothetical protein